MSHPNRVHHRNLRSMFVLCWLLIGGCTNENDEASRNSPLFRVASPEPSPSTSQVFGVDSATVPRQVSTLPQTVSGDPFDLLEGQFVEIDKWRDECTRKPRECKVETFVLPNSPYARQFTDRMQKFAKYNIYSRPGKGMRSITINGIDRDRTTTTALIRGCVFDSTILFMDGAIYDDKIISSLSIWRLQWHSDRWYLTDVTVERRFFDTDKCEESNEG